MKGFQSRRARGFFVLAWACALVALLLCSAGQAYAAANTQNLNPDQKGSINVTLTSTDGNPVGGELSLYKVADVVADGTGWHFQWVDAYKGVDDQLYNTTGKLSDAYSSELASKLDGLVANPDDSVPVASNGEAKFSDVGVGLYLVKQTAAPEGYDAIDSFVVSVPTQNETTGALEYNVDASPKAGAMTPATPSTPSEPTGKAETPVVPSGTLPQTGQLWWPVAALGAAGIVLVCAGLLRRRSGGSRGGRGVSGGAAANVKARG